MVDWSVIFVKLYRQRFGWLKCNFCETLHFIIRLIATRCCHDQSLVHSLDWTRFSFFLNPDVIVFQTAQYILDSVLTSDIYNLSLYKWLFVPKSFIDSELTQPWKIAKSVRAFVNIKYANYIIFICIFNDTRKYTVSIWTGGQI